MSLGGDNETPELTALKLPDFNEAFTDYLSQRKYIPELSSMLEEMSTASNSIWQRAIGQYAPTAKEDITQMGTVASSLLKGELPSDVQSSILRSSAAKALTSGVGTESGMGRNLTLRDLGLTSLQGVGLGTQLLQNQLNLASGMNPYKYDIKDSMFTTGQLLDRKDTQATIDWQIENQNNAIRAANDAQSSGIGSLIGGVIGTAAGAYFGGPAGAGLGGSVGSMLGGAIEGGTSTSSSAGFTNAFSSLGGALSGGSSGSSSGLNLSSLLKILSSGNSGSSFSTVPSLFQR